MSSKSGKSNKSGKSQKPKQTKNKGSKSSDKKVKAKKESVPRPNYFIDPEDLSEHEPQSSETEDSDYEVPFEKLNMGRTLNVIPEYDSDVDVDPNGDSDSPEAPMVSLITPYDSDGEANFDVAKARKTFEKNQAKKLKKLHKKIQDQLNE